MENEECTESISVRFDQITVDEIKRLAKEKHLPVRTMLRAWIIDRMDAELGKGWVDRLNSNGDWLFG